MGHGNRWSAVGGAEPPEVVPESIARIIETGTPVIGPKRCHVLRPTEGRAGAALHTCAVGILLLEPPFGLLTISLPFSEPKALKLMTAYPFPLGGVQHRVRVREVEEDCCGVEGWVHAEAAGGVPVTFFAADYFRHPRHYAANAEMDVLISGLAYSVGTVDASPIEITNPRALEMYRKAGIEAPPGEPLLFDTEDSAFLSRMEGWEPFDYCFQGPVKSESGERHRSGTVRRLTVAVARGGDTLEEDFDIEILAPPHVLRDDLPGIGGDVFGSMCLFGCSADADLRAPAAGER